MKVLLDECVPRKLRLELTEHAVLTVTEHGWSGIKNGKLLALAETEFEVFLTVDQNLKYQQNLKAFNIGVILLLARNNRLKGPIPEKADVDALHIAVAATNGMDYLLTWNCKHIANTEMQIGIGKLCRAAGFEPPVICTPEELLGS